VSLFRAKTVQQRYKFRADSNGLFNVELCNAFTVLITITSSFIKTTPNCN